MGVGDVTVDKDVMVAMRDGVRLRTDVYVPAGDGPFPVLLSRTPYSLVTQPMDAGAMSLVKQGYAVVIQHCRGRYGSEGEFHPVHVDIDDGYDAVEWAAVQPWSNGRVGMWGGSYLGMTQWMAALARPPHLEVIAPVASAPSFFGSNVWYWTPGVMAVGMAVAWSGAQTTWEAVRRGGPPALPEFVAFEDALTEMLTNPASFMAAYAKQDEVLDTLFAVRPLRDIETLRELAPWFRDWCDHPDPGDDYWRPIEAIAHVDHLAVPVIHVSGWYDFFANGTIAGFTAMRRHGPPEVRDQQRLVIGPWSHVPGMIPRPDAPAHSVLGMYDSTPGSPVMAFLERHLKDVVPAELDDPPVRVFVMGENRWRHEQEWPLPATVWTPYYLHSGGSANTSSGDGTLSSAPPAAEPADRFVYDPADPVPGARTVGTPGAPAAAPEAQATRADVLVYTTAPLERDVEVTGPVTLELWASTSAADTDFTAKLLDVFADGTVVPLCQGVVRASVALGHAPVPGAVYRYAIDLWATGNLFLAGHRMRLQVSSSEYPTYELNPNTGRRITHDDSGDVAVATQRVFHDEQHPSHLVLPVIPR